ncbi:gamma-glutamylcyclotransferase family protein [Haloferula sp.]|uniref:gamma-glutamylcyclotransferase family protein n=1 Tax=Haloferula sp. TaxID=2497595 RepID=UPI003C752392
MSDGGHLVFVYGTLRRGASNAFRMEGAEWMYPGFVRGLLYRVDWYPAIVLSDEGGMVAGELWRVDDEKLRDLDAFEGEEYRRTRVTVFSGNSIHKGNEWEGEQTEAWIWEWKGETKLLERILSGDWIDIEAPGAPRICTSMGCLSLLALPIGGGAIAAFLENLIGWNDLVGKVYSGVILLAAPVLALSLVQMADRRRERGQGWRDITTAVSVIWLTVLVLVVVVKMIGFFLG